MSSRYIVKKSKFKKPSSSVLAQKRQQKIKPKKFENDHDSDDDSSEESLIIRPSPNQKLKPQPQSDSPPPSRSPSPSPSNSENNEEEDQVIIIEDSVPNPKPKRLAIPKPTTQPPKPTTKPKQQTKSKPNPQPKTPPNDSEEKKDEEPAEKKKPQVSKQTLKRAIEIVKEIDPKQQKSLLKLEEILRKKLQDGVESVLDYGAIQYLISSFDLKNKTEDAEELRKEQDQKYKAKRMKDDVFKGRTDLTLPKSERLPDENDRIYKTGKSVYSGSQQKYKNPKLQDRKKVKAFQQFSALKRDPKALKKFGI